MVRIAIVDDEIAILKKIQAMIMQEFAVHKIDCCYFSYTSAKDFVKAQKKQPFDVVFLDIIMPEYTGFQAAAEIRNLQNQTYIIFITSNDESVYDAFDFQPFQFICKDCDDIFQNRMKHVIKSLVRHLKQNQTIIFQLPFCEEKKVKISDIIALKSDRNYLEVNLLMVLLYGFGESCPKGKQNCFPMILFVFITVGSSICVISVCRIIPMKK